MNHADIVKTLEHLIPLGVSSDPGDVLLKHASDNNLAPAQLERLGQMYNVAMTLNFMDKSANRGGTFEMVDMPDLLARYTDPQAKEAHVPSEWEGWFDAPSAFDKAASHGGAEFVEAESADDFVAMARGLGKSAAVSVEEEVAGYAHAWTPGFWDGIRKESADRFEIESVKRIVHDAEEDFRKAATALDNLVREGADFPVMALEASAVHGESGVKAASQVAAYLGLEMPEAPAPRIVRDEHDSLDLFKAAYEALETLAQARAYQKHIEKEAAVAAPPPEKKKNPPKPKNPSGGPSGGAEEEEGDDGEGWLDAAQGLREPGSRRRDRGDKPQAFNRPNSKEQEHDKELEKAVDRFMNLSGDIRTGVSGVLDLDTYTGGMDFDTHLRKIKGLGSGKNRLQMKVDEGIHDVQAVATLADVMRNDAIVSKADPELVVSLANTLAQANPEIASDRNLLTMALREAIQYEAIPLHVFKELREMGQKTEQMMADRNKNRDHMYAV